LFTKISVLPDVSTAFVTRPSAGANLGKPGGMASPFLPLAWMYFTIASGRSCAVLPQQPLHSALPSVHEQSSPALIGGPSNSAYLFPVGGRPKHHPDSRLSIYVEIAGTNEAAMTLPSGEPVGRAERSHPAESQERGTENSDQPQSTQMRISGEGVRGGWLNVRGPLR
jgi:hypothetical protein